MFQIFDFWHDYIPVCMVSRFSHVRLFATPWTVACQAPLSVESSRQEYWSRLPCPPPGDLPNWGIETLSPASPALQADSLPTKPPGKPDYIPCKTKLLDKVFLICHSTYLKNKGMLFSDYSPRSTVL